MLRMPAAAPAIEFGIPASASPAPLPPVAAQTPLDVTKVRLVVPGPVEVRPGTTTNLALRIDPLPREADALLIVVRGVPSGMTISRGGALGNGIWLVPAHLVGDIAVAVQADMTGTVELDVELATLAGRIVARAPAELRITTAGPRSGGGVAGTGQPAR